MGLVIFISFSLSVPRNINIFLTDTYKFLHDLSFRITKFEFLRSSLILQVAVILLCKMIENLMGIPRHS